MISWLFLFFVTQSPSIQDLREELSTIPSSPSATYEKELYRRALEEIRKENWNQAILYMEGFAQQSPQSHLADNAIFWMAQIYLQKEEYRLAHDELTRLVRDYPKSDRSRLALELSAKLQDRIQPMASKGTP